MKDFQGRDVGGQGKAGVLFHPDNLVRHHVTQLCMTMHECCFHSTSVGLGSGCVCQTEHVTEASWFVYIRVTL